MDTAYGANRKRAWISLALALVLTPAFLFLGLVGPPGWNVAGYVASAIMALSVVQAARMLLDPSPILRISIEGLHYRPFADDAVPWSEITAITHLFAYGSMRFLGRVTHTRAPASDQINFGVAEWAKYPSHPGRLLTRWMQQLGGMPPIMIQLWYVDGDPSAICTEIKKHWRGYIQEIHAKSRR
jgi:hypothetical protein